MKKKLFLLMNLLLTLMILNSCKKAPITPTVQTPEPAEQTAPEPTNQTTPEPTDQKTLEPTGEILSVDEAQDLLNNWYEWEEVSYMPEMDKEEEGVKLYAFSINYYDSGDELSGDPYCYAWVNSSTEIINFEEAGYSKEIGPNLYANIPDSMFPIPMRDGVVIPYDYFLPPDYVWGVAYIYKDKNVMESYQEQLTEAGFVDQGTVQSVESLWQYERESDGAVFIVEMYSEGETFTMTMYIN